MPSAGDEITKTKRTYSTTLKGFGGFLLEHGIIVTFVLLCVALSIASPWFLTRPNIMNVLRQTSINGVLAIGMTFVILTGGIDLSVGSILAFGGVVGASLVSASFSSQVYSSALAVVVALLSGLILGMVNGYFVSIWRMPAFVVTLGMLSVARGFTFIYTDGMPIPRLDASFVAIGQSVFLGVPLPVWIFAIVAVLAWVVLHKTKFGRHVYATGGNEEAAIISGVNVRAVKFIVYSISGLLSALGGIILSARTTAGLPQAGQAYELDAIAAVVIGGTSLKGGQGLIRGTLIGVLIIGVVNNGLDLLGVSAYYQQVFKGAIIVGAILLDSFRKD